MSSNGKVGNGHGNRRRKPLRQRGSGTAWQGGENSHNSSDRSGNYYKASNRIGEPFRGKKAPHFERPKWVPPKMSSEPLPVHDCPFCGKPIRDIFEAISDRDTGVPVHFDCVTARIAVGEILEKDEAITYIGGGRFGIVCFGGKDPHNRTGAGDFRIKKIIEWENKDKHSEWRSLVCEHYSVT